MLKVLVIAYYFPPMGLSGVQRTLKFVKYLKNYNWEPTVLTTSEVGYFAHDQSLKKELDETGVRVILIGGREPNSLLAGLGTLKLPREFIRKILNRLSQIFFIPDNKIEQRQKVERMKKSELQTDKGEELFGVEHFFLSHAVLQLKGERDELVQVVPVEYRRKDDHRQCDGPVKIAVFEYGSFVKQDVDKDGKERQDPGIF